MMVNPDRVAFTIFGRDIYWYGVLIAIGILLAVLLALREAKRKRMHEDTVLDICLVLIPCGIVGARLYYVLLDLPQYLADPIRIFFIWEGGLAIYGGIIGGLIGLFVYARIKKIRFTRLIDVIAPGLVLAQAIGRWGNFFNQEAYGLPVTNPDLLWFPFAVRIDAPWNNGIHYFNGQICDSPYHLATFFYESLWCALIFLFLWFFLRKRTKHDGDVFLWYAMLYSVERFFVEGLRGDSLWLIQDAVRASQLLSAIVAIGVLAFFLIRYFREKKLGYLMWPKPELALDSDEAEAVSALEAEDASAEDDLQNGGEDSGSDRSVNAPQDADAQADTEPGAQAGEETNEENIQQ